MDNQSMAKEAAGTAPKARRPVGRPAIHVTPERIQDLKSRGMSFRQIARFTGLGYGTVRRAYLRYSVSSKSYQPRAAGATENPL